LQAGWNVGVAGSAAFMQGANETYGNPAVEFQNLQIEQAIANGVEATGRTEPIELIPYNEIPEEGIDIYDGETGASLTDESLRE